MKHAAAVSVFLLSLLLMLVVLAQNASAEDEVFVAEHAIRLHIFSHNELYVFETVDYAIESNKTYQGTINAWIPQGAANISIADSDLAPLDFNMRGNLASFKLAIPPSNLTTVFISYDLRIEPAGFLDKQFQFETMTSYPVDWFSIRIISQSNFNVTASDNMKMLMPSSFIEQFNAYLTVIGNKEALNSQEKILIKFTQSQDILPYIGIAILAVATIAIILVVILRGKKKSSSADAQYEALAATLKAIEEDYKAGELTEVEYKKLKSEYEGRMARPRQERR